MTSKPPDGGHDHPPVERATDLQATVVRYDGKPDECTLHPREASVSELLTSWITAREGAYVEVEKCR